MHDPHIPAGLAAQVAHCRLAEGFINALSALECSGIEITDGIKNTLLGSMIATFDGLEEELVMAGTVHATLMTMGQARSPEHNGHSVKVSEAAVAGI